MVLAVPLGAGCGKWGLGNARVVKKRVRLAFLCVHPRAGLLGLAQRRSAGSGLFSASRAGDCRTAPRVSLQRLDKNFGSAAGLLVFLAALRRQVVNLALDESKLGLEVRVRLC